MQRNSLTAPRGRVSRPGGLSLSSARNARTVTVSPVAELNVDRIAVCSSVGGEHPSQVSLSVRREQPGSTCKRHVLIAGDTWKLKWSGEETKNGEVHEVRLATEALAIVQRAWTNRLPDCDFLFHVDGKQLGPWSSTTPGTRRSRTS
jgi:hypothetical protein